MCSAIQKVRRFLNVLLAGMQHTSTVFSNRHDTRSFDVLKVPFLKTFTILICDTEGITSCKDHLPLGFLTSLSKRGLITHLKEVL
jgi:hypothetical protein